MNSLIKRGTCLVAVALLPLVALTSARGQHAIAEPLDPALHAMLSSQIKSSGVLRIGGAFESLPYLNANPSDATKPVGIAPDIAALIGPILGVRIEWINTAWPGQIPGLQAGAFDALMGQISITAARERSLLDFVPYTKGGSGVVLLAGNSHGIQSDVATLCGLRIGAPSGSIQGQTLNGISKQYCASSTKGPIDVAEFQTASAAATAVLSGQIHGYLDSSNTGRGIARSSAGKLESVTLSYDQTKQWNPGLLGIAVTKTNTALTQALLGAMQRIVASESYATVFKKYDAEDSQLPLADLVANPLTRTPIGVTANPN